MFGLVKRQRLLDSERARVDLKVQIIRLEQQLAEAEERGQRAAWDLALANRQIETIEADRQRLLDALAAREPAAAAAALAPAAENLPAADAPQVRSLSFLEVATRATEHRNRHNKEAGVAGRIAVFQTAAAEAQIRRMKAAQATTAAPSREDL